jgi:hypothetical protein
VTATGKNPSSANVWLAVTLKSPLALAVIVPSEVTPLPQPIVAVKLTAGSLSVSLNAAIAP